METFPASHPIVRAQQRVHDVIGHGDTCFGVFGAASASRLDVLTTIRSLATLSVIDSTTALGILAAAPIVSTWSGASQVIHNGCNLAGSPKMRAIDPILTSMARAIAASHESIASPWTGSTRTGNRLVTNGHCTFAGNAEHLPVQTGCDRRAAYRANSNS
jgi:hypothetical protein